MPQFFEALMVICFGVSWPFSLVRSYRAKTTKGKSLVFLIFVLLGYIFGIASKMLNGNITYVFIFYCINFIMVAADLVIWFRNRKFEQTNDSKL